MIVIICLSEERAKEYFSNELKEFSEKNESVHFFTPYSDNERLKSCTVTKVLFENPVYLDFISEIELNTLNNRLRSKDGDYALFREHFNPNIARNEFWAYLPYLYKMRNPQQGDSEFKQQREKELVAWAQMQREIIKNIRTDNMLKSFAINENLAKEILCLPFDK